VLASVHSPTSAGADDGVPLRLRTDLPPEVIETLRPLAGSLVREARAEIERTTPEGAFRDAMVSTLHTAIEEVLARPGHRRDRNVDWKKVFRTAGRAEFLAGRTADPLQTSIRASARAAWRLISAGGRSAGLPAEALLTIAESIFTWVDQLSAVAVEGYQEAEAAARARAVDAHEQARRRLTRAILASEPVTDECLRALSETAGWPIPDRIVTIVVERRSDHDHLSDMREHREALVDLEGPPCVVLPDPGNDRQVVIDLIADRRAAVGPAVPLADGNRSVVLARRMLALAQSGAVPATGVTWCRDHLVTLLLLTDPLLTEQLREQTETAFAGLTPKQRDRMATTLLAWLQTRGTHNEIAARLDVHPQTVRYRINQLQQLFGDKLTDPDTRLTLELALRAQMLINRPAPD
jgi:hypothetical protein